MNAMPGAVGGAAVMLSFAVVVGGLLGSGPDGSAAGAAAGAVGGLACLGLPAALVGAFFGGLLGRVDWTGRPAPASLGGLGTIATGMVVIAIFGVLLALYRAIAPPVGP